MTIERSNAVNNGMANHSIPGDGKLKASTSKLTEGALPSVPPETSSKRLFSASSGWQKLRNNLRKAIDIEKKSQESPPPDKSEAVPVSHNAQPTGQANLTKEPPDSIRFAQKRSHDPQQPNKSNSSSVPPKDNYQNVPPHNPAATPEQNHTSHDQPDVQAMMKQHEAIMFQQITANAMSAQIQGMSSMAAAIVNAQLDGVKEMSEISKKGGSIATSAIS